MQLRTDKCHKTGCIRSCREMEVADRPSQFIRQVEDDVLDGAILVSFFFSLTRAEMAEDGRDLHNAPVPQPVSMLVHDMAWS